MWEIPPRGLSRGMYATGSYSTVWFMVFGKPFKTQVYPVEYGAKFPVDPTLRVFVVGAHFDADFRRLVLSRWQAFLRGRQGVVRSWPDWLRTERMVERAIDLWSGA